MRIAILAHGSRGDVQPYIALGKGLLEAGHTVCLAAPELFRDFVVGYGLEFAPLAGDPTRLMESAVQKAGPGWNPLRIWKVVLDYAVPLGAQVAADAYQACQGADAVVHSMLMTVAGHHVAREMNRPDFSALVFPVFTPTAAFPNPMFPDLPLGGYYNQQTHVQFDKMFWRANRLGYAWVRRKHPKLPRSLSWPFSAATPRPVPILYGFSPRVIPKPPEWSRDVHVTGYWFLDEKPGWQPPQGLVNFLDDGPAPVFIGFGSVISRDAGELARVALDALAAAGKRGVLLTGWGGLRPGQLPQGVYQVDSVPYRWLFPRLAAAVHHGGMGTTADALRAGIPSVVIPFTADQPFWGRRVYRLGAGVQPIPRKQLTAARLAAAIRAATEDPAIRSRAAGLGALIRQENGVGTAVDILERSLGIRS